MVKNELRFYFCREVLPLQSLFHVPEIKYFPTFSNFKQIFDCYMRAFQIV